MGIRKLVKINLLQFCFYKCFHYLEKYNMSLILSKPKPMLISKWKWKVLFLKDASLNSIWNSKLKFPYLFDLKCKVVFVTVIVAKLS